MTTEIIAIDPPSVKEGPSLPEEFYGHCSVLVGNKVFLIGGTDTEKKVLAIDITTSVMTYKRELNVGHTIGHACAVLTGTDGKTKIIVAGGNGRTTEIYDIENDYWQLGKKSSLKR